MIYLNNVIDIAILTEFGEVVFVGSRAFLPSLISDYGDWRLTVSSCKTQSSKFIIMIRGSRRP